MLTTRGFLLPVVRTLVPATSLVLTVSIASSQTTSTGTARPKTSQPSQSSFPAGIAKNTTLTTAALAFLASLTPTLRAKAVFPFDADERLVWHYVPMARRGLTFADMNEQQRAATRQLLQAALSQNGFKKVETIRSLETVLQEIENDTAGSFRNPERYYMTVFGEPSPRGAWALRYEGHHLSFHWTIVDNQIVASTPQFLGANPARVGHRAGTAGPPEGTRALANEENLARALVRSLTGEQRAHAIVSTTAPGDIVTGARRRTELQEDTGVTFSELDSKQRGLLLSLIREHATVQTEAVARRRLDNIRKAGLDTMRFAWMGGTEPGQGHYYRIRGKTFLIEYDNTQNDANHIHTVWRDFTGDFGEDALAEHYRKFPPKTPAGLSHGHDHDHR